MPIVSVFKGDCFIRIFKDYKQIVNQVTDCVPKTEEILHNFIRRIYPQILDNTHKGIFQSTRLQFGVHSISSIFQRKLEIRLDPIPLFKVRSDEILTYSKNHNEYF